MKFKTNLKIKNYLCRWKFINTPNIIIMKKLFAIAGIILFVGSLTLSSCSSRKRLCPAYPPSTYKADISTDKQANPIIIDEIKIEDSETL